MEHALTIAALLAGGCGTAPARQASDASAERPPAEPPLPAGHRLVRLEEHPIAPGESLGRILQARGIGGVPAILEAARPYADLSRIRAGRTLTFRWLAGRDDPVGFTYPIDEDRTLRVWLTRGGPVADLETVAWRAEEVRRTFTIRTSLWEAALAAGLRPADIVRLARIFEYEVDFNTELREGDRFTIVAEGLHREDGALGRLGTIHAVALRNRGRRIVAVHHRTQAGQEGWYDLEGRPLRRAFLRSPLAFSRVTSGFDPRRYHPILKKRRPHYGVDFGAPTGTPVRTVGDGRVVWAGKRGGYGLHVRVRHHDGWESSYSHLSRVLVRKGQAVKQGTVVGRVGATGLATGPHLHYELRRRGQPVDPMKAVLPPPPPLPAAELAAFARERDRLVARLAEADGGVAGRR